MDPTIHEIQMKLNLERFRDDLNEAVNVLSDMNKISEKVFKGALDDFVKITDEVNQAVDEFSWILLQAESITKYTKADAKTRAIINNELSKSADVLRNILLDEDKRAQLSHEQLMSINRHFRQLERINKANTEKLSTSKEIVNILNKHGLKTLSGWVEKFTTLTGLMEMSRRALAGAAQEATEWRLENFAIYGTYRDMTSTIRQVQLENKVLLEDAQKAAAALAAVTIDPDTLKESVEMVSNFTAATGASSKQVAVFLKNAERFNVELDDSQYVLNDTIESMRIWGLTSEDTDLALGVLNRSMAMLNARAGNDARVLAEFSASLLRVAASARRAGADVSGVLGLVERAITDPFSTAALTLGQFGGSAEDAIANMQPMANMIVDMANQGPQGAAAAAAFANQLGISVQMAKDLIQTHEENEEREERFAKWLESNAHLMGDVVKGTKEYDKALNELRDRHRRMEDPLVAVSVLTQKFTTAMKEAADTVMQHVGPIINWIIDYVPTWVYPVIGIILLIVGALASLTIALAALVSVLKFVGGSVLTVAGAFRGLAGAGERLKNVFRPGQGGLLKSIGDSLREFSQSLHGVNWANLLKAGGALLLLGIGLAAIALAYTYLGGDPWVLAAIGFAVLSMAISLALASKFAQKAAAGVGAMIAMSVALIAIAYALSHLDGIDVNQLYAFAIIIFVLAVAVALMGIVITAAAKPILAAAVVILALGVAFLLIAWAFSIFAKAVATLGEVDLLNLTWQLALFGIGLAIASGWIVLGMGLLTIATVMAVLIAQPFVITMGLIALGIWALSRAMSDVDGILKFPAVAGALLRGVIPLGLATLGLAKIAIPFAAAALLIGFGLGFLGRRLTQYASAFGNLIQLAVGLMVLRVGIDELTKSRYFKFNAAAALVARGINRLFSSIDPDAVDHLAIAADSISKIAPAINSLVNVDTVGLDKIMGDISESLIDYSSILAAAANDINSAIRGIDASGIEGVASSLNRLIYMDVTALESKMSSISGTLTHHSVLIAAAAARINEAISNVDISEIQDAVGEIDPLVSVKAGIEKGSDDREKIIQLLERLNNNMEKLNSKVDKFSGDDQDLAEIKSLIGKWLPEIADKDDLAASSTRW